MAAKSIHDDQEFSNFDFKSGGGSFEFNNCKFKNCDFQGIDLGGQCFSDCTFDSCNLSLAKLGNTKLNNAVFLSCKIWGVDFGKCPKLLFSVRLENTALNHSTFFRNELKSTVFKDCCLKETSFLECDLTNAVFGNCDLAQAVFSQCILEKADFRTARNYTVNPGTNKIKKAKFSIPEVVGLLSHHDIMIEEFPPAPSP